MSLSNNNRTAPAAVPATASHHKTSTPTLNEEDGSLYVTMISSTLSGMIARIPLHPIDTCKAKMQVITKQRKPSLQTITSSSNVSTITATPSVSASGLRGGVYEYKNVIDCLRHTYRHEGIRGCYRGFGITFFGSAPAACLYFTSYETTKQYLSSISFIQTHTPTFIQHFTAGLLAECISCVLWVPIDVIKERLQTQTNMIQYLQHQQSSTSASTSTSTASRIASITYNGNIDAIRKISATEGLRGIYKGYGATVASFGPFSALYLAGYDHIKSRFEHYYLPHQHHLSATGHLEPHSTHHNQTQQQELPPYIFLLSGALAGGIASFLTNPLDLAKLRIQVQRRERIFAFHYSNILDGLVQIVRREGWRGLWTGVSGRLAFQVPASAVTVGTFDTIKQFIIRMQKQDEIG